MSRVQVVTLPPSWIEVGSTSTLTITIQAWVSHFVVLVVSKLVLDIGAPMCPQEVEVAPTSAIATELSCGAIYFFMPWVVA